MPPNSATPRSMTALLRACALLAGAAALSACTTAFAGMTTGPRERLVTEYTVKAEETLPEIARAHGLGYVEILAANPEVDPFVPGVGTVIALPTWHLPPAGLMADGITVNIGDMRLYRAVEGLPPRSYPIGIGREELTTPPGDAKITRKVANPTWYPTRRMRRENPALPAAVGPGPENPLGTHALYLNRDLLRIHGTNRPWGVGSRVSSGCMRLYPEDIPILFEEIPVGTAVRIVEQEVKAGWVGEALYLEVHPSPEQADAIEYTRPFERRIPKDLVRVVADAAGGPDAAMIDWEKVRQAGLERLGYPVMVGVRAPEGAKRQEPAISAVY